MSVHARAPAKSRIHPWLWLKRYWLVVTALSALVFVGLGTAGFESVQARPPPPFLQSLYRALQLLVLEFPSAGDLDGQSIPVLLEVARVGAAVTAGLAVVVGVAQLFEEPATRLWVRWFSRNHVVICGLGRAGPLLAQRFVAAGHKVVAVHLSAETPAVAACRRRGIPVVVGDATDSAVLRSARVDRADYVVAVCGDDTTNVEVAAAAEGVFIGARDQRRRPLTCFVNLDDPDLAALVTEAEILAAGSRPLYLEYFNYADCGVTTLFDDFPFLAGADGSSHLLVVGLGAVGSRVVVEASRRFGIRRTGGDRLRITAIDRDAHRLVASLHRRYPWLENVCDLVGWAADVGSPQYQNGELIQEADRIRPLSGVCVSVGDDVRGLSAALVVRRRLPTASVPIVIRTFGDSLLRMLDEADHGPFEAVHAFNLLDRTARPEVLLDVPLTPRLARAIHEEYVRERLTEGESRADNASLVPWEELPPTLRRSNIRQARHIGVKLRAIGYDIAPLSSPDGTSVVLSNDDIERLAILEHDSWWEDRKADGWERGAEKDVEKKISPSMKPWDELTKTVKDYDRQAVRKIPDLLARAGFALIRRDA